MLSLCLIAAAQGLPSSGAATAPAVATAPSPVATAWAPIDPKVRRLYEHGLELMSAGALLEARAELSEAFFSGSLDAARSKRALEALTELADKTLFSPLVYENDPYTSAYRVARGDVIQKIVEREKLLVSPAFIGLLSGVNPGRLQPGQLLKLLRGPVHAVVSKSDFTMDLYLQREGQPRTFVKRLKVGLGKDGSTPAGAWLVGKKTSRARWTPPASASQTATVAWGQAGYPLGKEGYWIALQGVGDDTRGLSGYGLHGTNEPDSIGKAASLGCVRLADEDIELAYRLLAEKASTVTIRP